MKISYKGQAVSDVFELTKRVAHDAGDVSPANIAESDSGVIPARQSLTLMTAEQPVSSPALIAAFRQARDAIDVNVCYCSIFNECWMTGLKTEEPRAVKACPIKN